MVKLDGNEISYWMGMAVIEERQRTHGPPSLTGSPVVASEAGLLMTNSSTRRNILKLNTPSHSSHNEGYDLICIHPDPRHVPKDGELAQVRVQVKSRYATDCDRSFPVREASLDAFDYLIVVFQNIGNFFGRSDGSEREREPEFFTLPREFVREHHDTTSSWQRVKLRGLASKIEPYKNSQGFELIAQRLGIMRRSKVRTNQTVVDDEDLTSR